MTTPTATNGNVTMAAVAGYDQFSDRFVNNDYPIAYSIQDGTNWEHGYGTYLTGNILARTTILGTLNGGVYTSGGAALVLSGNNAVVRSVINEELFSSVLRMSPVLVAGSQNITDGYSYGITANGVTLTISNQGSVSAPVVNDRIHIYSAAAAVTGLVIASGSGANFNGAAGPLNVDLATFSFFLIYTGATLGWTVA